MRRSIEQEDVFRSLNRFFSLYENIPEVASSCRAFHTIYNPCEKKGADCAEDVRAFYEEAFSLLEDTASEKGYSDHILELQRDLYKEFELILSLADTDFRHHFIIAIPVADRPLMLRDCLQSLVKQCHIFSYGKSPLKPASRFGKISVFVFDDSADDTNSVNIRDICAETNAVGVNTFYVDVDQQTELIRRIPEGIRGQLNGLLGDFDGRLRHHKGASITRNIASLYIHSRLSEFADKTLVWFIDSDEEFLIKIKRGGEVITVPFINYFYWLDRIFTQSDVEVLTGKVVGDPPVTPSVMINSFLDDMIYFLEQMAVMDPEAECMFHESSASNTFSADYHDMAPLFGYSRTASARKYSCSLTGKHSALSCFADFSKLTPGFFYGLHPTRTQFFSYGNSFNKTERARTVYTGNYIMSSAGLRHFIPFAGLGLRMAGPTFGRLLRRVVGDKFVSANLPLLHRRTNNGDRMSEFRSGVVEEGGSLDLSEEFRRQFWGDVMLFSAESLSEKGYPEKCLSNAEIADAVGKVQADIFIIYREHQALTAEKVSRVRQLFSNPSAWWNLREDMISSVSTLKTFICLVEKNFGPSSGFMKTITGQIAEGSWTKKIISALSVYHEDKRTWNELLKLF
jgi:hypothetical protein